MLIIQNKHKTQSKGHNSKKSTWKHQLLYAKKRLDLIYIPIKFHEVIQKD